MSLPRISQPSHERKLQASKWIKFPILCDPDELFLFCKEIGPAFRLGRPLLEEDILLTPDQLLESYRSLITRLRAGEIITPRACDFFLPCAITADPEALYRIPTSDGRFLVKFNKPILLLQPHFFTFSRVDQEVRSMIQSSEAVFWGLHFSYPTLWEDAQGNMVSIEEPELFEHLRRWVRETSGPTPLQLGGKRVNHPMRLGRLAKNWVGQHKAMMDLSIWI